MKRRPSAQQQKRRISVQDSGASGNGVPGNGPPAKKPAKPRKGSRLDEGDYDNYIDSVMHQMKNLPPIPTVEPKLSHCFNACSAFGTGDIAKVLSKENEEQKCTLEGSFGNSGIVSEGDYYCTMPFGVEPPVPYISPLSVNQRGFYNQEFVTTEKRADYPRHEGYISPDLFYSSSPEPDTCARTKSYLKEIAIGKVVDNYTKPSNDDDTKIKKEMDDTATTIDNIKQEKPDDSSNTVVKTEAKSESGGTELMTWYDLDPDDTDEELENLTGPPNIMARSPSPCIDIVKPIPIKPKPSQSITISDLENIDKENIQMSGSTDEKPLKKGFLSMMGSLGVLPTPLKEKQENTKEVTINLTGAGSNKSIFKALKGLAKILEMETPKHWIQEDKSSKKALFRVKRDMGKDGVPLDLQSVINRGSKICRQCEMVIQHDMVKKRTNDLPFLSKAERDEYSEFLIFCDENCYLKYSVKKTGCKVPEKVTNLKELEEYQIKYKEEGPFGDTPKKEEKKGPQFKGTHYKNWTLSMGNQRKSKIMNEKDLTQMMFQ